MDSEGALIPRWEERRARWLRRSGCDHKGQQSKLAGEHCSVAPALIFKLASGSAFLHESGVNV
jgi:hypothetical protein